MRYFKVTNAAESHNGLQYSDGLIVDPVAFNPSGSCESGGIYYADEDHIGEFMSYGPWVREVTIPEDARTYKDPEGNKCKADKVILGPRVALLDFLREYVENHQSIGGGLDLRGLTSAEGLVLPQSIGGSLYLRDNVRREIEGRKK